jgi:DnaJ-domain-containing protein 1/GGDEF domain-containing protein
LLKDEIDINTNPTWEDYYKILQVHFLAEPEMIKNAYRKLSIKYHPDVCNLHNAEEKMKQIIRAYDVLSDSVRRKQYFLKWVEKNSRLHGINKSNSVKHYNSFETEPIRSILLEYLSCISKRDYCSAFDMLSTRDQRTISKHDFIKWQRLVSEVFELLQYDCEVKEIYQNILMVDNTYAKAANLGVKVIEKNHIMGIKEKDELMKSAVFENNEWSVFLGRSDLTSIIAKFNDLAKLKKRDRIYSIRTKQGPYIETIPGVLNKNAFLAKAKREQIRYNRYGNPFSLILCEIKLLQCVDAGESDNNTYELTKEIYKQIGIVIADNIRYLDFMSRWQRSGYILLLPETDVISAIKAANKIERKINQAFECSDDFKKLFTLKFRIAEQKFATFHELYKEGLCSEI